MHDLVLIDQYELEDEEMGNVYTFECPYCGARFEISVPNDEQKKNYEFWKDRDTDFRLDEIDIMNGHCLNCGHKVGVTGNFMLSDYEGYDLPDSKDKMNFVLTQCENCGCEEVRWDTSEEDHEIFPYWKQEDEENENESEQ